jgi:hypothetical protein
MNRGASAESPSASLTLLIAVFNPSSKTTNVSDGQRRWRSSSRVMTSPGFSVSAISSSKGLS